MENFKDPKKAKLLEKIVIHLVEKDFPPEHLKVIIKIITLF